MADGGSRNDALLASAIEAFGIGASSASQARLKEKLEPLATRLALEWLTGDARYDNQTQLAEAWLARLYDEVFTDEQPGGREVYVRFGFPLPRAQYIARLLSARQQAAWRKAAIGEVRAVLSTREKDSRRLDADTADTQKFELSLSKLAYDELVLNYEAAVVSKSSKPSPPRRSSSTPRFVWFNISATTLLVVLDHLKGAAT